MHYQLYLQPYQPYQIYQPCCYSLGITIPAWSRPFASALIPRSEEAVGRLSLRAGPPQATIRRGTRVGGDVGYAGRKFREPGKCVRDIQIEVCLERLSSFNKGGRYDQQDLRQSSRKRP